jgi:hypothetical protein
MKMMREEESISNPMSDIFQYIADENFKNSQEGRRIIALEKKLSYQEGIINGLLGRLAYLEKKISMSEKSTN